LSRLTKEQVIKEFYEATGPYAFDAVNLIIEALKKSGDDKKKLAQTIRQTEYTGILGTTKFDSFGQTVSGGLTYKVSQDKKWTLWETSEYAQRQTFRSREIVPIFDGFTISAPDCKGDS